MTLANYPGVKRVITAEFRTYSSDALVNPPHVKFFVRDPQQNTTTYTENSSQVTNPSTGIFKLTLVIPYSRAYTPQMRVDIQSLDADNIPIETKTVLLELTKNLAP